MEAPASQSTRCVSLGMGWMGTSRSGSRRFSTPRRKPLSASLATLGKRKAVRCGSPSGPWMKLPAMPARGCCSRKRTKASMASGAGNASEFRM